MSKFQYPEAQMVAATKTTTGAKKINSKKKKTTHHNTKVKRYSSDNKPKVKTTKGPKKGGKPKRRPQGKYQKASHAKRKPAHKPKKSKKNELRVMVVGGAEEVGRNMTMLEYGDDIILIDCGLQFADEDQPGIDYIIPNMTYLRGKEDRVRGMIITHGHMDHIGGIPHVSPRLNNPPIFSTKLTLGLIAKRQTDFPGSPKLDLRPVTHESKLKLGKNFEVEFIHVNHSWPDSLAIVVHTPEGTIIHTGDFKFDWTPIMDDVIDVQKFAALGRKGVKLLMSDSTNASSAGHQLSETDIAHNLEDILTKAKGRIIVGSFGSLLMRVQQIIKISEKLGRKVVVQGYSMRTNLEIAKELGFMEYKEKTLISPAEAAKMPLNKYVIMTTGAQGEENAGLMRIASREHKYFQIEKGDTVLFSSSIVPGNERTVAKLVDTLHREGADIINYHMMDVHAGGHAKSEDLKLLYRLVKPEFICPIEGHLFMLEANAKVARGLGWKDENVWVVENGQVMSFKDGKGQLTKEKIPTDYVMVDGLGVGDVSHVVLRDRQLLSEDGMVVVVVTVDAQTGKVVGKPDIISRGFVYMKSSKKLIEETRKKAAQILEDKNPKDAANTAYLKNKIRDELGTFIFKKTERQPMILPVVIEV